MRGYSPTKPYVPVHRPSDRPQSLVERKALRKRQRSSLRSTTSIIRSKHRAGTIRRSTASTTASGTPCRSGFRKTREGLRRTSSSSNSRSRAVRSTTGRNRAKSISSSTIPNGRSRRSMSHIRMRSPPGRRKRCLNSQTSTAHRCGSASFSRRTPRRGRERSSMSRSGSGCSALAERPGARFVRLDVPELCRYFLLAPGTPKRSLSAKLGKTAH